MSVEMWGTRNIYTNMSVSNFCILDGNQKHLEMFKVETWPQACRKMHAAAWPE